MNLQGLRGALTTQLALVTLLTCTPVWGAGAEEYPNPRVATVSGQGEIRAEPDQARLTLGVEAREPTLDAARTQVNRSVEALLKLTRELGIPDRQVNSTRLNVQPEYAWLEKTRTRKLVAYVVSRSVAVDLRELDKLGLLLERGLALGANQVGEPVLDHSRRVELQRDALALATKDALRNAEAMAGALHASVGAVRSLNAAQESPPPMPAFAMATRTLQVTGTSVGAPETYQPGELVFRASVGASFDLVPAATPPATAPVKAKP
jgi:uncharacterized protein YggE